MKLVGAAATRPPGGRTPDSEPGVDRGVVELTAEADTYREAFDLLLGQLGEGMSLLHVRVI